MRLIPLMLCWTLLICGWVSLPGCDREPPAAPAASATRPAETLPSPADRLIRVRLLNDLPNCTVSLEEPFDLIDPADGAHLGEGQPIAGLTLVFGEEALRLPRLGLALEPEVVDLVPQGVEPVGVRMNGELRRYRGWLRFVRRPTGERLVLNVIDIEDYLVPVVASELPASFHPEAFRAQAIAARTYAWYQKQVRGPQRDWDVTATESSQVYGGLSRVEQVPAAEEAVRATRGLVCAYDTPAGERIFCTYYCAQCGGRTQSVEAMSPQSAIPPLRGDVRCEYCLGDTGHRWGPVRIAKHVVTEQLRERYERFRKIGPIDAIRVIRRTHGDRPVRFELSDAEGRSIELEAENFRLAVDPTGRELRSSYFVIEDGGVVFVLRNGRGFGHGVGMCQHGANDLARRGAKVAGILRYYYPTARVRRAY